MVHLAFVDFYNIEIVRRIISPWNRILIPPTAYSMFCANVTVWEFFRMVLHVGISKFTNVALNDPYLLRSLFKRDVKHTFKKRTVCPASSISTSAEDKNKNHK